jgi:hypothetical protein
MRASRSGKATSVLTAHGDSAGKVGVGARPARRFGHLLGIGCRDQDLRHHAVGLQRDRRQHRVELGLVVDALRMGGTHHKDRSKRSEDLLHGGQSSPAAAAHLS